MLTERGHKESGSLPPAIPIHDSADAIFQAFYVEVDQEPERFALEGGGTRGAVPCGLEE